jgi:hypothetical protein
MLRSYGPGLVLASMVIVAASIVGCGSETPPAPPDAGSGGGGGGTDAGAGGGADAGGSADAGGGGGGGDTGMNDGGSGGGGASDGGSGGGGSDGGSGGGGGGGAPPECAGLMPETPGTMRTISVTSEQPGGCFDASGDGAGFMALRNDDSHGFPAWELFSPAPARTGRFGVRGGNLWQQPSGFIAWVKASFIQANVIHVDPTGDNSGGRQPVGFDGSDPWLWPNPQGGLAVAGKLIKPGRDPKASSQIWMFDANGDSRGDPRPLGSSGAIFGLGVDLLGRALVVYDGGSGNVDAQWFSPDGAPLTDVFRILSAFVAGPATWFEMAPLLGGGLALRRMDASRPGLLTGLHTKWLLTLSSGAASAQAAPDWLTSRPDTSLQPARNFRAYAILPMGAQGTACSQRLELLAPTGASCGAFDFPIAAGSCDTRDLRLGVDGTVLQKLPCEFESRVGDAGSRSNTLRFWPAALR